MPLDAPGIRGFLAAERDRTTPASAAKHYRNLSVYFRWPVGRDHAIIRILIDTGLRVSGLDSSSAATGRGRRRSPCRWPDRTAGLLRVRLKGGDTWWVPIGSEAAAAIDRYLRVRARSLHAGSPWLWIGTRGHHVAHFGDSGIRAMLRRRGKQAGVQNCYPHRFRHTFADSWLALGGNVDDLMNVAGWKSISMPLRYAKSHSIARAAEAHKRLSPGDRLSC
jgi:site-specific recombinase XerD